MKIKNAYRPDSRWDTWHQSKLRSSQRSINRDTLDQIAELDNDNDNAPTARST